MLSRHQDILFDVTGQTLYWDAPEGRPSSVTSVTVFQATTGDTGTQESATTGSASVETNPNTTLDGSAGAGQANPRLIPLTATTGVTVGRYFRIATAEGLVEWPEIVEVESGVSVSARYPLSNSYVTGETFVGTRISVSIDSTWVADESNITPAPGSSQAAYYRVRWVYVVSSVTYVHDTYFDLVRYPGGHTVTAAMLDAMYPDFADELPVYHRTDEGRRLLDEAYQQFRWELAASDVNDSAIRDEDAVNRATALRFGVLMAESKRDLELLEIRERRYNAFRDQMFRVTNKVPTQVDASGAGHRVAAMPLWSR